MRRWGGATEQDQSHSGTTMGFWEGETCEHCGGPMIERGVSLHRKVRGKYVLIEHVPPGFASSAARATLPPTS